MAISLRNLFSQKPPSLSNDSQAAAAQIEKPVEQIPLKKILARDPGGKFVSKKVKQAEQDIIPEPAEEVKPAPQPEEPAAEKTVIDESLNEPSIKEDDQQMVSTFYGTDIRKFYMNEV